MRYLAVLLCLAWGQAHAGFWDNLFGSKLDRAPSANAVPVTPSSVPTALVALLASDYRLGPGDKIGITVFNEKELSMDILLSDAGSFLYPFLGEVSARGMTIGELQIKLTDGLKDGYLVDPKLYVTILEYRPFFVNGEVAKPGGYPFQPGLTVRKAISLAGGLTQRASLSKLYVVHDGDPTGQPYITNLNAILQPGDILTIDQGFF